MKSFKTISTLFSQKKECDSVPHSSQCRLLPELVFGVVGCYFSAVFPVLGAQNGSSGSGTDGQATGAPVVPEGRLGPGVLRWDFGEEWQRLEALREFRWRFGFSLVLWMDAILHLQKPVAGKLTVAN